MKKLFSLLFFVVVFILSAFSKVFAYNNEEYLLKYNQDYFDEIMKNSNSKSINYKSFSTIDSYYNYGKNPDYFGGNYLKDNKLYINIIKGFPKLNVLNSLEYKIFEKIYDKIELKYVDYSMNYLQDVMNKLNKYYSENIEHID